MEIKELRYFLHVAETLSFHRAAERLNSSQPVVTRKIAQLEHSIGSRLFERSTRRVSLTPSGALLLKEVRPLIAQIDAVQRRVRHAVSDRSGRFVVGSTTAALQTVTPALIRKFKQARPDIELDVQEMTTQAQIEALVSAEIDLGFLLAPVYHPNLTTRTIHRERMRLAVPDYHPHVIAGSGRGPVPLSAFASDYFIMPPRAMNPATFDEIIHACEGAGFRPKLKECGQDETCIGLAKAGLGVLFILGQKTEMPLDGLAILEVEDPVPELEIALAWRTDDPSTCLQEFWKLDAILS